MKHGGSKPPLIYSKYENFNNFCSDCLTVTYLLFMDSELETTGYINVDVSHKTITGVLNGAFSQIYMLQSFEIDAEILNLRTSLKIRFYIKFEYD